MAIHGQGSGALPPKSGKNWLAALPAHRLTFDHAGTYWERKRLKSSYRGVCWHQKRNRAGNWQIGHWVVTITILGETYRWPYEFPEHEERNAAYAYDHMARILGVPERCNFPTPGSAA